MDQSTTAEHTLTSSPTVPDTGCWATKGKNNQWLHEDTRLKERELAILGHECHVPKTNHDDMIASHLWWPFLPSLAALQLAIYLLFAAVSAVKYTQHRNCHLKHSSSVEVGILILDNHHHRHPPPGHFHFTKENPLLNEQLIPLCLHALAIPANRLSERDSSKHLI